MVYDELVPIYIVRWPAFNVSLVRARNEEHLVDILDEVADPGGCRWAVYNGPLWIDLDLPATVKRNDEAVAPRTFQDIEIEGIEQLEEDPLAYDVSVADAETGYEMRDAVTKWAFPHMMRTIESHEERQPSKAELASALRSELLELLQYQWRVAQRDRRSGIESSLLQMLGLTVAPPWLKGMFEDLAKSSGRDDE